MVMFCKGCSHLIGEAAASPVIIMQMQQMAHENRICNN